MVPRVLQICSTYTFLAAEFDEIRTIDLENNYPTSVINTIIGTKLSQHRKKNEHKSNLTIAGFGDKFIFVEIPFIRCSTSGLKQKIV
ncbi:unnamed protein product [Rotaria sp. Silwood1]|nr:unnamed protein product [Rotaria sp. Silwood1]CAF1574632.1 unnamed protein product [Rotaria sp. Silwood1]CAF1580095.1 unnamed protein product [Rotaria sp. Silwood1]CAF3682901.1 unnamed protein product [Rotaria sp. Silwood1]CAF3725049.1 unnamed protein product [Rotaria sp. Silwood1]